MQLSEWTSSKGQTRYYVNGWTEAVGLEVERYKTGSIRFAYLDGEHISNAEAYRILDIRVWIDTDDQVHVDHNRSDLSSDRIVEVVRAAGGGVPQVRGVCDE